MGGGQQCSSVALLGDLPTEDLGPPQVSSGLKGIQENPHLTLLLPLEGGHSGMVPDRRVSPGGVAVFPDLSLGTALSDDSRYSHRPG